MRLDRGAGAAKASEGHRRCFSADVSVWASYALQPSDLVFFSYQGKVPSLVRRARML